MQSFASLFFFQRGICLLQACCLVLLFFQGSLTMRSGFIIECIKEWKRCIFWIAQSQMCFSQCIKRILRTSATFFLQIWKWISDIESIVCNTRSPIRLGAKNTLGILGQGTNVAILGSSETVDITYCNTVHNFRELFPLWKVSRLIWLWPAAGSVI